MQQQELITKHLHETGGIITSSWCRQNNIPTIYLSRMVKAGSLEQVDKGLYLSTEDSNYDEFFIFQHRYSKTIFSYETALYLLGLTDKIIQNLEVTVKNHYKFNGTPQNVTIHYVNDDLFTLGAIEIKTPYGNIVRTYSAERIVCDFIKNKDKCDIEVYVKLLKAFSQMESKDLNLLGSIAAKMGITEKVRAALEVLI